MMAVKYVKIIETVYNSNDSDESISVFENLLYKTGALEVDK
jgi:hypothetical protein